MGARLRGNSIPRIACDDERVVLLKAGVKNPRGKVVQTTMRAIRLCSVLEDCMTMCPPNAEDAMKPLVLQKISPKILDLVIEWCDHLSRAQNQHRRLFQDYALQMEARRSNVADNQPVLNESEWQNRFINGLNHGTLCAVAEATCFLQCTTLYEECCAALKRLLVGKTSREIRNAFNIRNDFNAQNQRRINAQRSLWQLATD